MANERVGEWQQTYTGRAFWPLDPRPEEIHIEDVAHALALQCRFAGACRVHYSVAEHSVRVLRCVAQMTQQQQRPTDEILTVRKWALLHDAPEFILTDLPRPIKRGSEIGRHYIAAEDRVMAAFCERFGLPLEMPPEVKVADNVLLMTEKRDLMAAAPLPWHEAQAACAAVEPLPDKIMPWTPAEAEMRFLMAFKQLMESVEGRG